jgi:hypothetical protein
MTPEEFDIQLEVGDITYRTYAVAPLDGFQSIKID